MLTSRSRNSASTAMSASLTGEETPLIQFAGWRRKVRSATSPASRTAKARRSRNATASSAANGETLHTHGRRIGGETEFQIVRGNECLEHVDQISGDGHLADGVAAFSVLDPEAAGTAAVVAGHVIDADADEVGEVETLGDIRHQRLRRIATRREMQVARPRGRRRRHAALGVPGGDGS